MSKRKKSLLQDRKLGHIIALGFYVILGYFLYVAASNMNYVWKWNSIPQYFVYTETTSLESPSDGKLILENDIYYLQNIDEKVKLDLNDSYTFDYKIGEEIYEGDLIASKDETKIGPV